MAARSVLGVLLAVLLSVGEASAQEPARSPLWIFNPDERVLVLNTTLSPYRRIVQLLSYDPLTGAGGKCTGALIGARTILTAAHCLYDASGWGGLAPAVWVYPARNGSAGLPYGSGAATAWTVPNGYATYGSGGVTALSELYDYGIVTLASDALGASTGWFTVGSLQTSTLAAAGFGLTVAGYDGDASPANTMWTRSRVGFAAPPSTELHFTVSSTHGSSGAPIWRTSDQLLVGVNQGGSDDVPIPAFGRRIDAEVLGFLTAACAQLGCTYSAYVEPVSVPATATPTATPTWTPTAQATPTRTPVPSATPRPASPVRVLLPAAVR